MTVNKLIEQLQRLADHGYGEHQTVIYEQLSPMDTLHHTTVEEVSVRRATWDKEKEVVALLR